MPKSLRRLQTLLADSSVEPLINMKMDASMRIISTQLPSNGSVGKTYRSIESLQSEDALTVVRITREDALIENSPNIIGPYTILIC